MAGGAGKINDYNQSLTPEQRKINAKKANKASQEAKRRQKELKETRLADIRAIAKIINDAHASPDLVEALGMANVRDHAVTNAAAIAMAVFQAAMDGNMKAVEKWEKYVGQSDETGGAGVQIIDDV